MNRLIGYFLSLLTAFGLTASAQVVVELGEHVVVQGTSSITIPVVVAGDDAFQDLVGLFEVEGGPTVTSFTTDNSLWELAPNGFTAFFASQGPPAAIIDPQISVESDADTLSASGTLFTVTIDLSFVGPGTYPLKMSGTAGGDSAFLLDGEEVPALVPDGAIRILSDLQIWTEGQFPFDHFDPTVELTVWGPDADPDEDGIINCLEYAFGTSPLVRDDALAAAESPGKFWQELVRSGSGPPELHLYYCSRTVAGFTYTVERAAPFSAGFSDADALFTELSPPQLIGNGNYTFHQLRYTAPLSGNEYFRVIVPK